MNQQIGQRFITRRLVLIGLASSGAALGCVLGCTFALLAARNSLEHAAGAAAARQNAALAEAHRVLRDMQASHSGYCSDAELASFRLLVFRSEHLKDAGRIRSDRIDCSAASGRRPLDAGPFKADFRLQDGAFAYRSLGSRQIRGLRGAALRLGSAYVVFGAEPSPAPGPIATTLAITMKDRAALARKAATAPPDYMTADSTGQFGGTLYATRCTDPAFSCVTATTTVFDAIRGESTVLSLCIDAGGIAGVLFDMGFPFFLRRRDLGRQLRRALEQDKLEIRYQPIVSMETRQIVGAEALARWTDDSGRQVDPEVFVKIAEDQGFIGLITRTVLKHVLNDFADTFRSRPDFRVSINVGAPDLLEPSFLPMLESALEKARVRPENLVIEITERSAANGEAAKETIRLLRHFGHSIHIDDFGSGFSNLDRLLYLYADTIKIDKAFTRTIDTESVAAVILPHIMTIARSLNLAVIVEGVEITRQADYFLPGNQKIYGQGWLFGRPMSAQEFLAELANSPIPAHTSAEPHGVLTTAAGALQAARSLPA